MAYAIILSTEGGLRHCMAYGGLFTSAARARAARARAARARIRRGGEDTGFGWHV